MGMRMGVVVAWGALLGVEDFDHGRRGNARKGTVGLSMDWPGFPRMRLDEMELKRATLNVSTVGGWLAASIAEITSRR